MYKFIKIVKTGICLHWTPRMVVTWGDKVWLQCIYEGNAKMRWLMVRDFLSSKSSCTTSAAAQCPLLLSSQKHWWIAIPSHVPQFSPLITWGSSSSVTKGSAVWVENSRKRWTLGEAFWPGYLVLEQGINQCAYWADWWGLKADSWWPTSCSHCIVQGETRKCCGWALL